MLLDKSDSLSSLFDDNIRGRIYGRDAEKKKIMESYERACSIRKSTTTPSRFPVIMQNTTAEFCPISEFVMIAGETGCGKTSLVRSILQQVVEHDDGYYISGQFDEICQPEPYSAFVIALDDFFRFLSARGFTETTLVRQEASYRQLKMEYDILINHHNHINMESNTIQRFKHMLLCLLIEVTTISEKPIVFVLDDLHWADESSLDLLFTLLVDASSSHGILYVGTYKLNDYPNRFQNFLDRIHCDPIHLNLITLCRFSRKEVNGLLSVMMQVEEDIVQTLSEHIHDHTKGNPFYIMECLRHFHSRSFLYSEECQRKWKIAEINEFVKKHTLDDLLFHSIKNMSESTQYFLACATCLGTKLDDNLLQHVTGRDPIDFHVAVLAKQRIVQYDNVRKCWRFSHDAIKEACHRTMPAQTTNNEFQYQLGRKLWLALTIEEIDRYIFVVVGLLSFGIDFVESQRERKAIAKLCLCAGERSVSSSNFQNAFDYLSKGVAFLGLEGWRMDYRLSLHLHNAATEVAYSIGNYDDVEHFVHIIGTHARAFCDTIPASCSHINVLGSKGKLHHAIHAGLDVLKKLGEPLSARYSIARLYFEAKKIQNITKNKSDYDLLNLPLMHDEQKLAAMKIMNAIFLYVFMISETLSIFLGFRLMNLSLKYGKNTMTPAGFILYGTYIARTGNVQSGFRFGRIGLQIFEQFNMPQWTGRIYYLFYGILHNFRRPIKETVEPLEYACNLSLEKGDVEYGLLCGNFSIFSRVQVDTLKSIYEEIQAHNRKLLIFGQLHNFEMLKPTDITVRNLLWNANPDVNCPTNELVDENEYNNSNLTSNLIFSWSHALRILIYYLFGHYDKAHEHSQICITSEVVGINANFSQHVIALFFIGLANIAYARSKHKSKSRNAKRCIQRIQEFAKYAPSNSLCKKFLLEAELASLSTKTKYHHQVFEKYSCAIALSKDAGFIMETAMAYECAAKYLLRTGDYDMASSFFDDAIIWYRQWGSEPKVKHLMGEIKQHECIKVQGV